MACLASACGSGTHSSSSASSNARKSAVVSGTTRAYRDCESARYIALDILNKGYRNFTPVDIRNMIVSSEQQASSVLTHAMRQIKALGPSAVRDARSAQIQAELSQAIRQLDAFARQAATSRPTGIPAGPQVRNLVRAFASISHICAATA
jgi:hypothetical protein